VGAAAWSLPHPATTSMPSNPAQAFFCLQCSVDMTRRGGELEHATSVPRYRSYCASACCSSRCFLPAPPGARWSLHSRLRTESRPSLFIASNAWRGIAQQEVASRCVGGRGGRKLGAVTILERIGPVGVLLDIEGTSVGSIGYRVSFVDCGTAAPASCSPIAQDCGAEWLGCYQGSDLVPYCMHRGYADVGTPCSAARWCDPGLVCVDNADRTQTVCSPYCDGNSQGTPTSCDQMCAGGVASLGEASACRQ
jgi:hypothetical protein